MNYVNLKCFFLYNYVKTIYPNPWLKEEILLFRLCKTTVWSRKFSNLFFYALKCFLFSFFIKFWFLSQC